MDLLERQVGKMCWPGEEDFLDWSSMFQAIPPSKIAHRVGDRFLCVNTLTVQAQERKRLAQERPDDCFAGENHAPSLRDLSHVRIKY